MHSRYGKVDLELAYGSGVALVPWPSLFLVVSLLGFLLLRGLDLVLRFLDWLLRGFLF
jgi:hypothetical protein